MARGELHDLGCTLEAATSRSRIGALDPEDLLQEAWVAVLGQLHRFDDAVAGGGFDAWATVVARNRLINLTRQAVTKSSRSLTPADLSLLPGREPDPSTAFEREAVRVLVRDALEEARGRLSGASHRIVVLRWVEGHTVAEIAAAMGIPATRVRDRHRRALPVLRELLGRRIKPDFSRGRSSEEITP